jgi:hypothetical protein
LPESPVPTVAGLPYLNQTPARTAPNRKKTGARIRGRQPDGPAVGGPVAGGVLAEDGLIMSVRVFCFNLQASFKPVNFRNLAISTPADGYPPTGRSICQNKQYLMGMKQ